MIFLYASHMWGLDIDGKGPQYDHIDAAMENAIEVFRKVYGARPLKRIVQRVMQGNPVPGSRSLPRHLFANSGQTLSSSFPGT